ncbi:MAG: acetyltransferase [Candidatus Edwardsbacteria bacterium]|nr:acetyltransferase [Candidatus Edwardsbacteria bacterium]
MMEERFRTLPRRIIIWGGTGQAKVNRPIVEHYGSRVVAVFDDTPGLRPPFPDVPLLPGWPAFAEWVKDQPRQQIGFCIAIGNPHGRVRLDYHRRLAAEGLAPVTLVHPAAWVADNAVISEGSQIMAGAVVQPEAVIGRQCIVNTRASIDHECVLEDGAEVAVGATLCGLVRVGANGWVCAGAIVLPRLTIGHDAIVGAGAVVTKNIPPSVVAYGVPARVVRPVATINERTTEARE